MEKGEKKQKIQWDEVTIAEHDKERGSRQKIDEAPTPYRYQSESDQSECESDAETLAKKAIEESDEAGGSIAAQTTPQQRTSKKKKNVLFNSNASRISDSWEAINAKLQYEKHLQDTGAGTTLPLNGAFSNSVQRREFYQNSGSNSNSNIAAHGQLSPKVTLAGPGKIQDLQTNFGEMVSHPAPAAFSPQFTRKDYRPAGSRGKAGGLAAQSTENEADAEDEGRMPAHSPTPGLSPTGGLSPEKAPKTVFIRPQIETVPISGGDDEAAAGGEGNTSMSCGSASGDDESSGGSKRQFLNKRAGHYNEFKVLQAMRAKLAAEAAEEDEDD